ncbi:sushi domain-containing protein 3 [Ictalurus furcatus]|uniref:sushi domain-containing protein 3 n=1 Tax=Ictalurus furcatus TaxID=66913 RepID=UPI002350F069|nr:sushi domain-containing protein 3 [Ictalurus furcatus]XP_053480596.1 sushi domain-containing protein 3 [Ictalurus furcatus]
MEAQNRSQTGGPAGLCTPMPSPPLGTFKIEAGDGITVGTVMTLQCPFLYRAVSGGLISCEQGNSGAQWIGSIPECKPLQYDEKNLRLALLLSTVSIAIILFMSIIFIVPCLLKHVKRDHMRQLERERNREAARLWHQLNEEEQRESFYNQNGRINNNNNNNSSSSNRQEQHQRCCQKNYPDPEPSTTCSLA